MIQHNTSPALINANLRSILTLTDVGGANYSLQSFFAGGRTQERNPDGPVTFYSVATSIDILGNLLGGGTVMTSIVLDTTAPYDFAQYFLPASFTHLTSVVFTAQGNGDRAGIPDRQHRRQSAVGFGARAQYGGVAVPWPRVEAPGFAQGL